MIDPMAPSHLSFVLTSAGLALGLVAQLGGWVDAAAVALLPLAYTVLRSLISGKAGVDFSQQGRDAAGWPCRPRWFPPLAGAVPRGPSCVWSW